MEGTVKEVGRDIQYVEVVFLLDHGRCRICAGCFIDNISFAERALAVQPAKTEIRVQDGRYRGVVCAILESVNFLEQLELRDFRCEFGRIGPDSRPRRSRSKVRPRR